MNCLRFPNETVITVLLPALARPRKSPNEAEPFSTEESKKVLEESSEDVIVAAKVLEKGSADVFVAAKVMEEGSVDVTVATCTRKSSSEKRATDRRFGPVPNSSNLCWSLTFNLGTLIENYTPAHARMYARTHARTHKDTRTRTRTHT